MSKKGKTYIGTSGWHYKHWKGPFYPEDIEHDRMLSFYKDRLHTVEINNSFYQLPDEKTLKAWMNESPKDFIFSIKGSRYITHMKKLKDPKQSLDSFLRRVKLIKKKLGCILFQLPPRWGVNPERLEQFLMTLPEKFRYAFEFRDESWFNRRVLHLLEKHNCAFCIYQIAGRKSPKQVTADFIYIRLHGPGRNAYQGEYSKRELSGWAGAINTWINMGKDVYCYFDNDQNGYAPNDALKLQKMISAT